MRSIFHKSRVDLFVHWDDIDMSEERRKYLTYLVAIAGGSFLLEAFVGPAAEVGGRH